MTAARISPFQAIVLGLLVQRRRYGYQIANLIERGVWAAIVTPRKTAVYAALRRLESLGHIAAEETDAGARHGHVSKRRWSDYRRWYRPTPQGLQAYQQWVTGRIGDEHGRAAVLVRIGIAAPLGTKALHEILDKDEALCDVQRRTLQQARAHVSASSGIAGLCNRLVIAEREITLRGIREWTQLAREELRAYERHSMDASLGERCRQSSPIERMDDAWRR